MDMPFELSRCQSDCVSYMLLTCEAEAATHSPLGVMMRTAAGLHLQGLSAAAGAWGSAERFVRRPWAGYGGEHLLEGRVENLSSSMSETGRPGQLFTHLIGLRDKASFDTDSRQLVRTDTQTAGRLMHVCTSLQQRVCTHGNKPHKHTAVLGAADPWAGFIWGHRLTNAAGR